LIFYSCCGAKISFRDWLESGIIRFNPWVLRFFTASGGHRP
jgi:hypothetical protein